MQVTVTGRQIDVGDSLREQATAATIASVERYSGNATEAHVVFAREGHRYPAEISVRAGNLNRVDRGPNGTLGGIDPALAEARVMPRARTP
jgi:ribosome-associated translation inhibitor RaiA